MTRRQPTPPDQPPTRVLDVPATLRLLREGELDVTGRLVEASNATLFGTACSDDTSVPPVRCVYKPTAGERPLWDFPDGTLAQREVAAYVVSEALGWGIVPPTVLREGPFGPGMCQLWIDADDAELVDVVPLGAVPKGWLRVLDATGAGGRPVTLAHADDARLRRVALFDAVVNNADRKGGHLLPVADHVYGIDHGVCFNVENKLRTVLWGWAGGALRDDERDALRAMLADLDADGPVSAALGELLTRREVARTATRVRRLLDRRRFPVPSEGWPSIPWPPF